MHQLNGVNIDDSIIGRRILILTTTTECLLSGEEYEIVGHRGGDRVTVLDEDDDRNNLYTLKDGNNRITWEWVGPTVETVKSTKTQRKSAAEGVRACEEELNEAITEARRLGLTVADAATPVIMHFQPVTPKREEY